MRVTHVTKTAEIKHGPGTMRILDAFGAYISGQPAIPLKFVIEDDFGEQHAVSTTFDGWVSSTFTIETESHREVPRSVFNVRMGDDRVRVEFYAQNKDKYRGTFTDRED